MWMLLPFPMDRHLHLGTCRQNLGLTSALGVATMASPAVVRCLLEAKASVEARKGMETPEWVKQMKWFEGIEFAKPYIAAIGWYVIIWYDYTFLLDIIN